MHKEKVRKYILRTWKQWRVTIFFIVFVIIPVKSSLADWNWVPTGSMNPTILEGDLIYVNKVAYDLRFPLTLHRVARWSDPKRGDIVVCFSPEDDTRLVKRVVAVGGDTVEMRNNVLLLNGQPLEYTEIDAELLARLSEELRNSSAFAVENLNGVTHSVMSKPTIAARRNFGPLTIDDDHYFVLGDNRDLSRDSRFFGLVHRKLIVGKANAVVVSFDKTDKYQARFDRFFRPLK
jgi:signal peptidase I